MGVKTNAVLTALNLILGNKLRQEEIAREDKRKLDNLKKEYIQKQTLRRDFEPTAVAAEEAKNMQALNQANLFNNNYDQIAKLYTDDLNFKSKYQPEENEYKLNALRNQKSLQPHQYDYDLVKLRTGIDKMLAQPELDAKKQEYEDKLNSIKLSLYNQRLANEKARGDKIKALGSLTAGGGKGGNFGSYKFNDLMRTYVEIQNAMENIRKNSQTDGSDYLNVPGYKDLEDKAIKLGRFIQYLYPEFNPQDPAAVKKVLDEAKDIGGAEGNIDKAIAGGEQPGNSAAKEAAIESMIQQPQQPPNGVFRKSSDQWGPQGILKPIKEWGMNALDAIDKAYYENIKSKRAEFEAKKKSGYYNQYGPMGDLGQFLEYNFDDILRNPRTINDISDPADLLRWLAQYSANPLHL